MISDFIHLRVHSAYSLSEGAIKVDSLVKLAQKYDMPALAITDSGNLFCSLEFSKACASSGIQPIIGCALAFDSQLQPLQPNSVFDKIVLYAKNDTGYTNLLKLASMAFMENAETTPPHIRFSDLEKHHDGLIALTGGTEGTLARLLLNRQTKEAEQFLQQVSTLFGDSLYIELTRLGLPEEEKIEEELLDLAYEHHIPIVATNDVYFADRAMYEAHDALLCIAEGRYVSEDDRKKLTKEYYFKSPAEMRELFKDLPEAIENTMLIARRCHVQSEERKPILPRFQTETGRDEEEELREQALAGLEFRLSTLVYRDGMDETEKAALASSYKERLLFELNVIIGMKFPGYFLIVSDFIKWSKRHHIPVGPGRGSGAGSMVAWALEITDLDPIRFGLLFERFLNPERISMPDFDIDFCQERRDEVIEYVQQRYGRDQVAQIITFGKLQARAVLRDVGRVLQMPYGQVDRISKLVPNNPAQPVTLSEAIELEPELRKAQKDDEQVAHLINIALQLEGLNRHASTHAAGVVIADRRLDELVPLYRDQRSTMPVVQYSMKYTEAAGLVKFDFLGLKTLTVLAHACKLLAARGIEIDLTKLPLDDAPTYQLLARGEAVGVFQFESAGMRDALRKLRPDKIEDLIALGALYRPGPMDNIPTYIACKHGLEQPDYLHPSLEPILKETFGVIIYQEQVMQIAQQLSGYSLGGADLLRRAMGKKIKSEMDAQRAIFIDGAVKKGVDKKQASTIFDLVDKFAGYGFNKSHAAAYAIISYQTAYIKANYPVEFLVASMNLDIHDTDKLNVFKQEAQAMKVTLLPPDINHSEAYFSIENLPDGKQAIRYGLSALKNVGVAAIESIIKERDANGIYKDIFDLAARNDSKAMNKRQMESMIKAGACDALYNNRAELIHSIEIILRYGAVQAKERESSQISLFGEKTTARAPLPALEKKPDFSMQERLSGEFEAIGFYLGEHPLDNYKGALKKLGVVDSGSLEDKLPLGTSTVRMAGMVTSCKIKVSARGRFAYVALSDQYGAFEVAVYNEDLLNQSRMLLESNQPVFLTIEARRDEGGMRLIADQLGSLDEKVAGQHAKLHLWINEKKVIADIYQYCSTAHPQKRKTSLIITAVADKYAVDIKLPQSYQLPLDAMQVFRKMNGVVKVEEMTG